MPSGRTVAERIDDHLDALRPAERKVARALLADYPRRGLDSVAALASAAGVSSATVVRFAAALEFEGFPELQSALIDEIGFRAGGPLGRTTEQPPANAGLEATAEVLLAGARQTARRLPRSEYDTAIGLLADRRRRVTATGGRSTSAVAEILAATLEMMRSDVHLLVDPARRQTAALLELGRRDVLVAYDLPRYQESTVATVSLARRQRATVVLVTDDQLSPAAKDADVVLPVSVASPSPFAGLTASTLVTELILTDVHRALGEAATTRLEAWETFRRHELLLGSVGSTSPDR